MSLRLGAPSLRVLAVRRLSRDQSFCGKHGAPAAFLRGAIPGPAGVGAAHEEEHRHGRPRSWQKAEGLPARRPTRSLSRAAQWIHGPSVPLSIRRLGQMSTTCAIFDALDHGRNRD